MRTYFSFYFFAAALVFVRCQLGYSLKRETPWESVGSCELKRNRPGLTMAKDNAAAKPREVPFELRPSPKYKYNPGIIFVKRCTGYCKNRREIATPMSMETKLMVVERYPVGKPYKSECAQVEVEQHTKCKCACDPKYNVCNKDTQIWNPESCSCKCNNSFQRAKSDCLEKHDTMEWDAFDCSCKCKLLTGCMNGLEWNPVTCKCRKSQR